MSSAGVEPIVIGIGNEFRRDDGIGLTVAERVTERRLSGVRVLSGISEPAAVLEAWDGAALAVVVDAVTGPEATAGRIRRWAGTGLKSTAALSSHALGLAQTFALGQALQRVPDELVVFTVDVTDTGHGVGLTPAVAAAASRVVELVVAELSR